MDELADVQVGEVADRLQVRHIVFQRVYQRWFQRGVKRGAARPVVEVDHLLGQAAALGDQARGLQRFVVEEVGGVELGLQERTEHLRVGAGIRAAHHHAVQGRVVELGAVIQQLGLALVDQQTGPGNELRQPLDLTGFQRRGPDLRLLVEHLDSGAGVGQRAHQRAVAGRPDAGRHLGTGQVGQDRRRRIRRHHHHVQGALGVVAGDRDDLGGRPRVGLGFGAVDQHRVVAHRADIDLLGDHLRGDRGTGVVVLPHHPVFGAGPGGDVGEPALQVALGAQQGTGGHRVDGLGLVAHHHLDGVAGRRRVQRAAGRGDGGRDSHRRQPDHGSVHGMS
ncbi:hypothetical protein C1Y40_02426 [Mycobacterium talmoniae]|uniref:Uncharacterized protein n=1 Tax=Mycobacterium talmoniae TaxID=1858794 RepID=A0A2S8BL44_9MYCO|nr:hypothetical protein C1Y40_02426 [Mycobacterium talmoniae]